MRRRRSITGPLRAVGMGVDVSGTASFITALLPTVVAATYSACECTTASCCSQCAAAERRRADAQGERDPQLPQGQQRPSRWSGLPRVRFGCSGQGKCARRLRRWSFLFEEVTVGIKFIGLSSTVFSGPNPCFSLCSLIAILYAAIADESLLTISHDYVHVICCGVFLLNQSCMFLNAHYYYLEYAHGLSRIVNIGVAKVTVS